MGTSEGLHLKDTMQKQRISTQTRILKSILDNGTVNVPTKKISEETGLTLNGVRGAGRHLITRSIAVRRTIKTNKFNPPKISYWSIRPQKLEKAKQMVREAYGKQDDY